ncbi:hypothetical protein ACIO3O_37825 [Streptomyces sp. NPDC087440]|uniref:hypothetical protein n=1 Tax=Streptomyces sp. NPDC087440 TaxID=3365790 RepID=UPI003829FDAF
MVHDDRAPSQDIKLAATPASQVNVGEDEMEVVLTRARALEEADLIELLMEPRRTYPPLSRDRAELLVHRAARAATEQ